MAVSRTARYLCAAVAELLVSIAMREFELLRHRIAIAWKFAMLIIRVVVPFVVAIIQIIRLFHL